MFAKIDVNGKNACELYTFLKSQKAGPDGKEAIKWNFEKFVVDGEGQVVARYDSKTTPEEIDGLLG